MLRIMRSQASMGREHERLAFALLLSLLFHTLLLSLTFGGQGLGLPGFGFPWRDRRIEVPDVRVVLVPTQVTAGEAAITSVAEPVQQASIEQRVASGPAPTPSMSPASPLRSKAVAIPPAARMTAGAKSKRNAVAHAAPGRSVPGPPAGAVHTRRLRRRPDCSRPDECLGSWASPRPRGRAAGHACSGGGGAAHAPGRSATPRWRSRAAQIG